MTQQTRNINKKEDINHKIEPDRNSEVEEYNSRNEKFTRRAQQQI